MRNGVIGIAMPQSLEGAKERGQFSSGDRRAGVSYLDNDLRVIPAHDNLHRCRGVTMLHRVPEQIRQDLTDARCVETAAQITGHCHRIRVLRTTAPKFVDRVLHHTVQVDVMRIHRQPSAHAAAREVEQVVEHLRHSLGAADGARHERGVVCIEYVRIRHGLGHD